MIISLWGRGRVMGHQELWRRVQRRALWSALNAQRQLNIAPAPQYALEQIAYLRHVQHARETGERQNPDHLVGGFLTPLERQLAAVEDLSLMRSRPTYHYILTRTRHYDTVLRNALSAGAKQLVFFGTGADTRSFRFREALDRAGVKVIETELEPWLSARVEKCRAFTPPRDFRQIEFALGKTDAASWIERSGYDPKRKTLFIAEGVTPYISDAAHQSLLRFAAERAPAGSILAYDGKYQDADGAEPGICRFPRSADAIAAQLTANGVTPERIVASADLQAELAPYDAPLFKEDVFLVATA
ncbi:MAG: class I SAM-dependent methyltransferase, partial [Hyphococcus sp.]